MTEEVEQRFAEAQAMIDSMILEFIAINKRLPTAIKISPSVFKRFTDVDPDNPELTIEQKKSYEGIRLVVDDYLEDDTVALGDMN